MMPTFGKQFFTILLFCCVTVAAFGDGQSGGNSASVNGTVTDPSGAVVAGATVEIHNPVTAFDRTTTTDAAGKFTIPNVPFNSYHMTVKSTGFAPYSQDLDVRSVVPINLPVSLSVASSSETVTVQSEAGEDLVETTPTFHTDLDQQLIDKLPIESSSSSVSSLVTLATPGVTADSNGLMHGLGEHADNSYSVDGQPITDQQSKVFSNQIPIESVQSMEVISGAPPAEYGDKTSIVVNVTTRSGQGMTTPKGSITTSYGNFGSSNIDINLGYGGQKWGNFISASGLNTGRFLDAPEFAVMHDKGNQENVFDRVDYQVTNADALHVNLGFTRSWFQNPNTYDQQDVAGWPGGLGPNGLPVGPTDQRSQIRTFNIAPSWTRLISNTTLFTLGAFVRHDQYNYYASPNPFADFSPSLQSQTVGQDRSLTNAGLRSDISYVKGIHNLKAGVTYQQTFVNENDNLAIVDPNFLSGLVDGNGTSCLASDGTPIAPPCTTLAPYDLTRDGTLFGFHGHTDVKELSLYIQDAITAGNWTFNLGVRGDLYNGLTVHREAEPRLGIAYNVKRTNTVLRVSYARTLETPFNENLVLSSEGCASPVLNPLLACAVAGATPLSPGWRNEFHAGLQQAFGKYLVFSGEYIWKYTHNASDFSVLGNTPITFPIEWDRSKIPGFAGRISMPNYHGLSALVVFSSVAARFFLPQVGGAGATPSAAGGVFRIDHDEKFNQTTHIQYQPWKDGPWLGFNWRYDSGMVAGRVPCAGGDCVNGPLGSDSVVDASIISADQQFQAGLFCGPIHAAPTIPISSSLGSNLCPASQYGSTLISIPAPGTSNADRNPPRIMQRHLFDLAVGDDNLFHGERYKWSAQITVVNLANNYSLYNFLSTFSGTHYVTPRAYTAQLGFNF